MPNIISTTVDDNKLKELNVKGYMPNIISTTVDLLCRWLARDGYMPNIISTTVDLAFQEFQIFGLYA